MKKIISIVLLTALLLSLISSAMAYSYSDNYPEYYIYSTMPKGYCYLYDQPSDINGRNLGQLKNGEKVKKIFWSEANDGNRNNGCYFVICENGKYTAISMITRCTATAETAKRSNEIMSAATA